jgi:predicted nucleic-acid-binding Zn-ribbon protein
MSRSEVTKCPKCGGKMERGKRLKSFTEITLTKEDEYVGDSIHVFCCKDCGYIELYKEKKEENL